MLRDAKPFQANVVVGCSSDRGLAILLQEIPAVSTQKQGHSSAIVGCFHEFQQMKEMKLIAVQGKARFLSNPRTCFEKVYRAYFTASSEFLRMVFNKAGLPRHVHNYSNVRGKATQRSLATHD